MLNFNFFRLKNNNKTQEISKNVDILLSSYFIIRYFKWTLNAS